MKIFQLLQKHLAIYGIASNQQPINLRNGLSLAVYSLAIALIFTHIYHEVNTFQEYANSIFMAAVQIAVLIIFVSLTMQMQSFFNSVDEAETLIDQSEFQSIFFCIENEQIKLKIEFVCQGSATPHQMTSTQIPISW